MKRAKLLLFVAMLGVQSQAVFAENLQEVLDEYEKVLLVSEGNALIGNKEECDKWIERIGQVVAGEQKDDLFYFGLSAMAQLHYFSGDSNASLKLYETVYNDTDAVSDIRLQASRSAIAVVMSMQADVNIVDKYCDDFDRLYAGLGEQKVGHSEGFEFDKLLLDYQRSRIYQDLGGKLARSLRAEGNQSEADRVMNEYNRLSSSAQANYIKGLEGHPEFVKKNQDRLQALNLDMAGATYRYASLLNEQVRYAEQANDVTVSRVLRQTAITELERFFTDYPGHVLHSDNASALLLGLQSAELLAQNDGASAFVSRVTELIPLVQKGHALPSFLRKVAFSLSQDQENLIGANRVIDVLLGLEREWFPDEYKDHVNYQWPLLVKLDNLLRLGKLVEGGKVLEELKALAIQGEVLQSLFESLQKRYEEEFQDHLRNMGVDLDLEHLSERGNAGDAITGETMSTGGKYSVENIATIRSSGTNETNDTPLHETTTDRHAAIVGASAGILVFFALGGVFFGLRMIKQRKGLK